MADHTALYPHTYRTADALGGLPVGAYLVMDGGPGWTPCRRVAGGWLRAGQSGTIPDHHMVGLPVAGPLPDPTPAPLRGRVGSRRAGRR
ncbi:MAG: hypothetical protein AB7P02_17750 [Alphaproteobacteria bacterium]